MYTDLQILAQSLSTAADAARKSAEAANQMEGQLRQLQSMVDKHESFIIAMKSLFDNYNY